MVYGSIGVENYQTGRLEKMSSCFFPGIADRALKYVISISLWIDGSLFVLMADITH